MVIRRISFPSFGSWFSKPKDMRLINTFRIPKTVPQYDDYLERYPDLIGRSLNERVKLTMSEEMTIEHIFYFAKKQYKKDEVTINAEGDEVRDHWDHTLPGDCENQCLYMIKTAREVLGDNVADAFSIVLCVTESGEGHAILCLHEIDEKNRLSERLMDFRMSKPLLPIGQRVFNKYRFLRAHIPGTNAWQFVVRKNRRKVEEATT